AEDGIRNRNVTEFRRVLFRSKTYDLLGNHCLETEEVHQVIPDIFVPVQESYQIVPWSLPLTPLVHGRFLGQSALDIRLPVNYTFLQHDTAYNAVITLRQRRCGFSSSVHQFFLT